MAYNFQYVPTSGDLSGVALEKQTERAINEIGAVSEATDEKSQEAIGTANNALAVAQSALGTSQIANTTAQEAKATAEQASADVQGAYTAASTAQTRADSAYDLATNAQTDAQTAISTADVAVSTAQGAVAAATSASELAGEALQAAEAAESAAALVQSIYKVNTSAIDLNDFYDAPEKYFLTAAGVANSPLPAPIYFDVFTTDDRLRAVQTVWGEGSPNEKIYRTANIIRNIVDPPTVTWSAWVESAGGGGVLVGKIDFLPFRVAELPVGWYFCNGDQYPLSSPQGAVLTRLSTNFKTDWGITTSGSNISLPNMFHTDGRGYFLRATNGTTRQVGNVELDALQNITGTYPIVTAPGTVSGAMYNYASGGNSSANTGGSFGYLTLGFDASRSVGARTATETRALNRGMTPAIFLGV